MGKKKTKTDLQGNALRAIFTRLRSDVFAMLEEEADEQKRSVSQQAALILEQYYFEVKPLADRAASPQQQTER